MIDLASTDFLDPKWQWSCREVERSDFAVDEVGRLVQVVDTLEACTREVGGVRAIVSKFGPIERTKHGKTKHFLI